MTLSAALQAFEASSVLLGQVSTSNPRARSVEWTKKLDCDMGQRTTYLR